MENLYRPSTAEQREKHLRAGCASSASHPTLLELAAIWWELTGNLSVLRKMSFPKERGGCCLVSLQLSPAHVLLQDLETPSEASWEWHHAAAWCEQAGLPCHPQEASGPTSCWKQGQPWGQTTLLGALSSWVVKRSRIEHTMASLWAFFPLLDWPQTVPSNSSQVCELCGETSPP